MPTAATETYSVSTTVETDFGFDKETVYEGNNLSLATSIVEQDKYAELLTWQMGRVVSRTFRVDGKVSTFKEAI